ncbi:TIGR03643 family protein [Alkalicoccus chagannorensis]|uniref:TIGR03643 family protein n=1 Tax=Alkalicoccus chagannorensis TaxID=427072 RepID=UPI000413C76F|nr:TIGR03643 family protein [Alkalicoccus chagannorensis]
MKAAKNLTAEEIDRVVEMAWEDRTPFEAIEIQFGLKEKDVIKLMRKEMKESSFRMWRKRVNHRSTKHAAMKKKEAKRFRAPDQKPISY